MGRQPRAQVQAVGQLGEPLRATITTWSPSSTTAEKDSPVMPASRLSVGWMARGRRAVAR